MQPAKSPYHDPKSKREAPRWLLGPDYAADRRRASYEAFVSSSFTNAHNTRFAGVATPCAAPRCTIRPLR